MRFRGALGVRASTVAAVAVGTMLAMTPAAQAHLVRVGGDLGFAQLSGDHLQVSACRMYGGPPVWATVRYRDGRLQRYNGPAVATNACYSYGVSGEPNGLRFCWGNTGSIKCTAFVRP
ncbi:hypothetical protein [Nonomuraea sp. NPDC048826]|uniref:hypothetical protein n=1 Tax=Nonomuraea sp. NPDC048826 TaxID=3364347 RepID=UPI00371630CF